MIAGVGLQAVLGVATPFGNLPGDIRIENQRGVILIPLATMLLLSIVLSVIFMIVGPGAEASGFRRPRTG